MATARKSRTAATIRSVLRVRRFIKGRQQYRTTPRLETREKCVRAVTFSGPLDPDAEGSPIDAAAQVKRFGVVQKPPFFALKVAPKALFWH